MDQIKLAVAQTSFIAHRQSMPNLALYKSKSTNYVQQLCPDFPDLFLLSANFLPAKFSLSKLPS